MANGMASGSDVAYMFIVNNATIPVVKLEKKYRLNQF